MSPYTQIKYLICCSGIVGRKREPYELMHNSGELTPAEMTELVMFIWNDMAFYIQPLPVFSHDFSAQY